jgi:hypothetical protein
MQALYVTGVATSLPIFDMACTSSTIVTISPPTIHRVRVLFSDSPVRGNVIGRERVVLRNVAKGEAARVALQYFNKHGLPDPIGSQTKDAVLNLEDLSPQLPASGILLKMVRITN